VGNKGVGDKGKFKRGYTSLWESWDLNGNGSIDGVEFRKAEEMMNLDNREIVSDLEKASYFSRNKYVLCRPWIAELRKK
jgi:hypothetical protein